MCSRYERLMKPQAFQLANRIKSHAQLLPHPAPRPADGSLLANLRQKLRQATPTRPVSCVLPPVVRFMCCDEFWRRFCEAAIHLMARPHTHTVKTRRQTKGGWRLATPPLKVQLFKLRQKDQSSQLPVPRLPHLQ